jgi:hypothetical protein
MGQTAVLRVYVGTWNAAGRLRATLIDTSSTAMDGGPDEVDGANNPSFVDQTINRVGSNEMSCGYYVLQFVSTR